MIRDMIKDILFLITRSETKYRSGVLEVITQNVIEQDGGRGESLETCGEKALSVHTVYLSNGTNSVPYINVSYKVRGYVQRVQQAVCSPEQERDQVLCLIHSDGNPSNLVGAGRNVGRESDQLLYIFMDLMTLSCQRVINSAWLPCKSGIRTRCMELYTLAEIVSFLYLSLHLRQEKYL